MRRSGAWRRTRHPPTSRTSSASPAARTSTPATSRRYDDKEDAGAAAEVALLERHGLGPESLARRVRARHRPVHGRGWRRAAGGSDRRRRLRADAAAARRQARAALARQRRARPRRPAQLRARGEPADFVYSRLALHHLPDFWKVVALERIRGTAPAGRHLPARGHRLRLRAGRARGAARGLVRDRRRERRGASGPGPSSRSTCATSTRPSPGCSSRCWPVPASRSSRRSTRARRHLRRLRAARARNRHVTRDRLG